jgi:gamma-glutamyltranspeptidase/glutathione hydrolase
MNTFVPKSYPAHLWNVRKPAAESQRGMVVTQAFDASEAGRHVLHAGGNAVDAAIAAALALAVVEPWNSGLGGVGFALVHNHDEAKAHSVHFGPVAPQKLDPSSFTLTGRPGNDLFPWPEVTGDANAHGPLSFCLPTALAGYGTMHDRWGRLPFKEVIAPAIALAKRGVASDWFTTLMLAQAAPVLRQYPSTAKLYLRDGLPPVPPYQGVPGFLPVSNLAATLEQLQCNGWQDFYQGDVLQALLSDLKSVGSVITEEELRSYRPEIATPVSVAWGNSLIQLSSGLNAGPTLASIFENLTANQYQNAGSRPDPVWYQRLATAFKEGYAQRLSVFGDAEPKGQGCTTHICATDADGSTVSMTTTLLSSMGSRLVLENSGVLMNNGVLWFDPREGQANSVQGGKRPISNMCPAIVASGAGRPIITVGAAGGRRIMASVAQLLMFVHDFDMGVEEAAHWPRIDVSDPVLISADRRLPNEVISALSETGTCELVDHDVLPINFARPSVIDARAEGRLRGISDVCSPWSAALGQLPRVT